VSSDNFVSVDSTLGSKSGDAPSPLISTFLFIAAVADGERSLARTYLHQGLSSDEK
jgi:hypothetical protein